MPEPLIWRAAEALVDKRWSSLHIVLGDLDINMKRNQTLTIPLTICEN